MNNKRIGAHFLSIFLSVVMLLSIQSPVTVFATEVSLEGEAGISVSAIESNSMDNVETDIDLDTDASTDNNISTELDTGMDASTGPEVTLKEEIIDEQEITVVSDYSSFITELKVLEQYANDYAAINSLDATELVINYIRTGIEEYNTDSWAILAGAENTAFVSYVADQDAANGTTAQALRGIGTFQTPNGQTVEFAHMFGAMNIAYYNNNAQTSADFGSWAGDICDLMDYSKGKLVSTDLEAMARKFAQHISVLMLKMLIPSVI